jgi:hypothetical protein
MPRQLALFRGRERLVRARNPESSAHVRRRRPAQIEESTDAFGDVLRWIPGFLRRERLQNPERRGRVVCGSEDQSHPNG